MNVTPRIEQMLADGFRLDDLQTHGLAVLQHPAWYRFASEPVLLAHFCRATARTKAVDLGSGCGIIGILLTGKYGAARCDCVELQPAVAELCAANVALNGLEARIRVVAGPAQEAHLTLGLHAYDLVVSNPPYTPRGDGEPPATDTVALSRHEIALTLDDLVASADRLVRYGGKFCFVHQAERLAEICCALSAHGFAPKRILPVCGRVGLAPSLVLVEARKGGKSGGLRLENPLCLYRRDGTETEELAAIYARETAGVPQGELRWKQ